MKNSSAQPNYSITSSNLSDVLSIDMSTISISNTGASTGYISGTSITNGGYTITTGASGTSSTWSYGAGSAFSQEYIISKEFENCFPDWNTVQKMCEEYPGLKIAFEKFATTYRLVKDDYNATKTKK